MKLESDFPGTVVEHNFFFLRPKVGYSSKLAASTQALITLGSPSDHLAHLSLSNLGIL